MLRHLGYLPERIAPARDISDGPFDSLLLAQGGFRHLHRGGRSGSDGRRRGGRGVKGQFGNGLRRLGQAGLALFPEVSAVDPGARQKEKKKEMELGDPHLFVSAIFMAARMASETERKSIDTM